jgi:hypothetical protein
MKKLTLDFLYYLRQGYGVRTAWSLAKATI